VDKEALKLAESSGVTVSLCTGRAPEGCVGLLQQLELDGYHAFYDGALVLNPEKKP